MSRSNLVQSLVRGTDILALVAESGQGVMLSEIAAHLGVRPTTAHNLARTLVKKGFLEKTVRPVRYRLGWGLFALVKAHAQRRWIERAAEVVRSIGAQLPNATVILLEPSGGELIVALRLHPTQPDILERYSGRHELPYGTATALCLLAFAHPDDALRWRQHYSFSEYGARRWADESQLDAYLAEAHKAGYVCLDGEQLFRVAAPVAGPDGLVVAALGVALRYQTPPSGTVQATVTRLVLEGARKLGGTQGQTWI